MASVHSPSSRRSPAARATRTAAPAILSHRSPSTLGFVDFFCGYGGSSTGATQAGVEVVAAYNHSAHAIEVHAANHPRARHCQVNIMTLDPSQTPRTAFGWFSPSCTRHTVAAGAKKRKLAQGEPDLFTDATLPDPLSEADTLRALMMDVPRFAEAKRYPVVLVENVVEAVSRWDLYPAWEMAMRLLRYRVQVLSLNTRILGVPQDRDRVFIVCTQEGLPTPDLEIRPDAFCPACAARVAAVQTWKPSAFRTAARLGRPVTGKFGDSYTYTCPTCTGPVQLAEQGSGVAINPLLPAPLLTEPRHGRMPSDTIRLRLQAGLDAFGPQGMVVTRNNTTHSGRVRPWSMPSFTLTASPTLGVAFPDPVALARHVSGMPFPVDAMRYRRLDIQEARAIAGFPPGYLLPGVYEDSHKGLGNAVTPAMAQLLVERTLPCFM